MALSGQAASLLEAFRRHDASGQGTIVGDQLRSLILEVSCGRADALSPEEVSLLIEASMQRLTCTDEINVAEFCAWLWEDSTCDASAVSVHSALDPDAGQCEGGNAPQEDALQVEVLVPWLEAALSFEAQGTATMAELMTSTATQLGYEEGALHQLRSTGHAPRGLSSSERLLELRNAMCIPCAAVQLTLVVNKVPDAHVACCTSWSQDVVLPAEVWQLGARIARTEHRAMKLSQLQSLGALLKDLLSASAVVDPRRDGKRVVFQAEQASANVDVNMYIINTLVVMPLTKAFCCSYAELVASEDQPPIVFVSHFWGNPFWQTLRLLEFHARQRGWQDDVTYWICTFANNQHSLEELASTLEETPFVKAIRDVGCRGTVALLDSHVTTFRRIWCVLENYISTDDIAVEHQRFYDLAAWLDEGGQTNYYGKPSPGQATVQLDYLCGQLHEVAEIDGTFPFTVALEGVSMDLTKAEASQVQDQKSILHYVAGTPPDQLGDDPPQAHANYTALNRAARRRFVPGAMFSLAGNGSIAHLQALIDQFPEEVNARSMDGATALIAAAKEGHTEVMQLLLAAGAHVDVIDDDGASAPGIAAYFGRSEAVQLLLAASMDPNSMDSDKDGVPLLHIAAGEGHVEVLKILLQARADASQKDSQGKAALELAEDGGHVQAAQLLRRFQ